MICKDYGSMPAEEANQLANSIVAALHEEYPPDVLALVFRNLGANLKVLAASESEKLVNQALSIRTMKASIDFMKSFEEDAAVFGHSGEEGLH